MSGSSTLSILITGATGNIGIELTKQLSAQKLPFRAMVRSSKASTKVTATDCAGIVIGDFNNSKSIADALEGVDRAFLLTNVDVTPEAMREALLNIGLPHWQVDGLIEDYAHYRQSEASSIASGVQDATGTPARSFDDFARDYTPAFS